MIVAPLPPDEKERLQALSSYEAFGTEPEPAFDRVTSLAARIFRVPVALITLIDQERQWLKSRHGVSYCDSSRDVSFCAHAILARPGEVLVVPDAARDARFADNPLVTGPRPLRFYAGAPIRTSEGLALGSLCLIDRVPREDFSAEQRAMLTDLAATVMELFESRVARIREGREAARRRDVQAALQRSERRFRRMASNIPGMVYQFVLEPGGEYHFPFVSEGCREFYGIDPQAIYDRPEAALAVLSFADQERFHESVARSAETLEPWHWHGQYRAPDGTLRWLEGRSRPERLAGDRTLWNGVLMDITERKQAQMSLEDSHALLRAVIDGTGDTVFLKDRDSRYILMNPAGAALLGMTADQVVGRDDFDYFSPEVATRTRERDQFVLGTGQSITYEEHDIIDGAELSFLTTKSPYRDSVGNLVGVIGIAREITEHRRAALALREAKEEAEKANAAKSEFLSRMSHELRTPLNAILGFGQLLEISHLDAKSLDSVGHILRAGRHLLSLIDEVLAISRIEAGRLTLSLEPVALGELTRECLLFVSGSADDRRITCEDQTGGDLFVRADLQRLRQVLLNFLSNAVKYNHEGGRVTLSCRPAPPAAPAGKAMADGSEAPDDETAPWLRVEVRDTGPGLTARQIGKLFTPFERLDAGRTRTEGTGLGLAVSKALMEAMRGRIGVDSTPGEGSAFWFELPLAADPRRRLDRDGVPVVPLPAEGCRGTVLYIEDNLSNLSLIECLLAGHEGLELLSALRGLQGLEMARERQPDLILLDLHLPDLSGWEVLARLRADGLTQSIPVVVISADATSGQIARLRALGAQEYLTKPIDIPQLLRVLAAYLKPALTMAGGA